MSKEEEELILKPFYETAEKAGSNSFEVAENKYTVYFIDMDGER